MRLQSAAAGGASNPRWESRPEPATEECAATCKADLVIVYPSTYRRSRHAQMGELWMVGIIYAGMLVLSGERNTPVMTNTKHGNDWQAVGALLVAVCVREKSRV